MVISRRFTPICPALEVYFFKKYRELSKYSKNHLSSIKEAAGKFALVLTANL